MPKETEKWSSVGSLLQRRDEEVRGIRYEAINFSVHNKIFNFFKTRERIVFAAAITSQHQHSFSVV